MGDRSPVGSRNEVWFFTSIEGPRESTVKHYAFVTELTRGVVANLDDRTKSNRYHRIDGNWYLALDDAD